MKKYFLKYKNKIYYTIGTLLILNLVLLFSNRGILISESCYVRDSKTFNDEKYHPFKCSKMREEYFVWKNIYCVYWMGRGTFERMTGNDYCKMVQHIDIFR